MLSITSIHRAPLPLKPAGFNTEVVTINSRVNATARIWDLGGGDKISPLFRHYYPGCRGIIFIIPSFWGEDDANYFLNKDNIDEKPEPVNRSEQVICILKSPRVQSENQEIYVHMLPTCESLIVTHKQKIYHFQHKTH